MTKRRVSMSGTEMAVGSLPAIIDGGEIVCYADYHRRVAWVCQWLRDHGIESGQRIGLLGENSAGYIVTIMSLLHLGAVACPLSSRYPIGTVEKMLGAISCDTVMTSMSHTFQSGSIRTIPFPDPRAMTGDGEKLIGIDMEQDATILFTSGTTTLAKAVLHTFGSHYYNALGSNLNLELQPSDRWLLSLPLNHVGGLGIIFRCLLAGAAVVVPRQGQKLTEAVSEFGITHLSLVATQLMTLLDGPPAERATAELKCLLVGGGFVPRPLIERAVASRLPVYTTYGSTEAASQVTTTAPDDPPEKLYTSGRILKYRQLKLSNDGEILVQGETLFKGYVIPSSMKTPFDSEGWFATGDLGRFDSDGYLIVTGRRDNMFISGGENIYPEEIEAAIRLIEGVNEVVVVPAEDSRYGQVPVAFVRLLEDSQFQAEKIRIELLRSLPKFKIPAKILPWPDRAPQSGIKPDRTLFHRLVQLAGD